MENNGFAEYYQALPYKQIVNELRKCSAKSKIIVVDQSHSNQFLHKLQDQSVHGAIAVGAADFAHYSHGYKLTEPFIRAKSTSCVSDIINVSTFLSFHVLTNRFLEYFIMFIHNLVNILIFQEAANSSQILTYMTEDAKPSKVNLYGTDCVPKKIINE